MKLKILLLLTVVVLIKSSAATPWYKVSSLPKCENSPAKTWENIENIQKIKLGPVTPTAPYSEGEYYSLPNHNVTLQCKIPTTLPIDSFVVITYNSSYVDNMKAAVTSKRRVDENITSNNNNNETKAYETCTIAAFEAENIERLEPSPNHLPSPCSAMISVTSTVSEDQETVFTFSIPNVKVITSVGGTGTYQCSLVRSCDPAHSSSIGDNQEPIGVSKSVFVKVYEMPDYWSDLVYTCSGVSVSVVLLLVAAGIEYQVSQPKIVNI